MEYEFAELEHLVNVLINPVYLKPENVNDKLVELYAGDCIKEVTKLKKRFSTAVLAADSETNIIKYVQQHQGWLIGFADTIYHYLRSKQLLEPEHAGYAVHIIKFYKEIYRHLDELLQFLETQFTNYFDFDARLNHLCHEQFALEIQTNLKEIKKAFKKNSVCTDLVNITCQPFEQIENSAVRISYRKRSYLRVFINEFVNRIKEVTSNLTTELVCNLLLYLNFNHTRFFNYYIMKLVATAKSLELNVDLINYYLLKMKLLNQVAMQPAIAYSVPLPSIRDQIGTWISEEIYYLEKRQPFEVIEPTNSLRPEHPKIHTTLAVAQLSFALKLLIDSGIIVNKNYTEILKVVAQNFKTDRIENISEDSLRNKYYNIEKGTADKMKDVVIKLLNMVRKY